MASMLTFGEGFLRNESRNERKKSRLIRKMHKKRKENKKKKFSMRSGGVE
jgi:hypothetical protein